MTAAITLVAPYFGPPPPYIRLVLRTMAANPSVRWLVPADEQWPDCPSNVTLLPMPFSRFRDRVQSCFDFRVCLDRPYKICDFRPAFGEIFAEELAGCDFWGHSDFDVLFGNIRRHLPDDVLDRWDKVLVRGCLSLYRNTDEARQWFRAPGAPVDYRQVLASPDSARFDEWPGIYAILEHLGVPIWHEENIFDLDTRYFRTRARAAAPGFHLYTWEAGEVYEYVRASGELVRRPGLLIHLQKRALAVGPGAEAGGSVWVGPGMLGALVGPHVDQRANWWAHVLSLPAAASFHLTRGRRLARRLMREAAR